MAEDVIGIDESLRSLLSTGYLMVFSFSYVIQSLWYYRVFYYNVI